MRLQQTLEKYLPLVSGMLFPAAGFACGLIAFLSDNNFSSSTMMLFHWTFYLLSVASLIILLNFNQGKTLFLMITIVCGYIGVNYLKNSLGEDYALSVWYQNLKVILSFNLLLFYLYSGKRFLSRISLFMVFELMFEFTILEFLARSQISIGFDWGGMNIVALVLLSVLFVLTLINSVKDGKFYDYTVMFVSLSVAFGLYFSETAAGVSMFFFLAQFFLSVYTVYTLLHNHYYDSLTGFYSHSSYLMQTKNFPLKYSLGLICIDSCDKLLETVGRKNTDIVIKMIASIIESMVSDDVIYRYATDQFIIIYKKLDKKEAFAQLENIRRTIAGLSFEYSTTQRPLKLTVSCSVSEKKRSDAGAADVLMRADKAMRKTLKFSHNVTSRG